MFQRPIRRTYLLLQGPHGSFFRRLRAALAEAGHQVRRINFNGGDREASTAGDDYRGTERGWPRFVEAYLARHQVTDLVLFGDGRPLHQAAIRIAEAVGVQVHVFEEGYIRPDWVTLERDGVNGHSRLPRDPDWYVHQAQQLPPVPGHPPIPSHPGVRGWGAFFYYADVVLNFWRYPLHRTHRTADPVWEGIRYLWRRRWRDQERAASLEAISRLETARYMLFPLQLNSDFQIRLHSPFAGMAEAIMHVLRSFASHAPADLRLAVKEHPLDSGLINWRHIVGAAATELGVADRVDFLESGDVVPLVRGAKGLVTVNSTTGTFALAENVPVCVLGTAVYDMAGITHRDGLDRFWHAPEAPDPMIYDAFYRVLVDRCLVRGAFLNRRGVDLLIAGAVARLSGRPALIGSAIARDVD